MNRKMKNVWRKDREKKTRETHHMRPFFLPKGATTKQTSSWMDWSGRTEFKRERRNWLGLFGERS